MALLLRLHQSIGKAACGIFIVVFSLLSSCGSQALERAGSVVGYVGLVAEQNVGF